MLPASTTTLFDTPLPHNSLGWAGMLVGLWGSLGTANGTINAFIDHFRGRPATLRLTGGWILPIGWILWGGAFIYGEASPVRVLIVLLGLLGMVASAAELHRSRGAATAPPEGEGA